MLRDKEKVQAYQKMAMDSKSHVKQLEAERDQLKELLANAENQVNFYRNQCLKFYSPERK